MNAKHPSESPLCVTIEISRFNGGGPTYTGVCVVDVMGRGEITLRTLRCADVNDARVMLVDLSRAIGRTAEVLADLQKIEVS